MITLILYKGITPKEFNKAADIKKQANMFEARKKKIETLIKSKQIISFIR